MSYHAHVLGEEFSSTNFTSLSLFPGRGVEAWCYGEKKFALVPVLRLPGGEPETGRGERLAGHFIAEGPSEPSPDEAKHVFDKFNRH